MLVPILSARTGWHTDELRRALAARGHDGVEVPYQGLAASLGGAVRLGSRGVDLTGAPAVLARIIPAGSLEQLIFRVDALHALEDHGVRVLNPPRAIERTVDKFYTSALLEHAGLPTPETVACEEADAAMEAFRRWGDVVVKPLFGSMGLGLVRVREEALAWRVFRTVAQLGGVFYVQRTIEHGGRDIRAFVVGGRVLGAIERRAPPGGDGWRTNVSQGGTAVAVALPPDAADLAVRAAAAVAAEYAGVDLVADAAGRRFVLEVNGIPGWRGLQQATGLDVAGAIVDHLLARVAA